MEPVTEFIDTVVRFKMIQRAAQIPVHQILQTLDDTVAALGYHCRYLTSGSYYEGVLAEVCGDRDQMACDPGYPPVVSGGGEGPVGGVSGLVVEEDPEQPAFLQLRLFAGAHLPAPGSLLGRMTGDSSPYASSKAFMVFTGAGTGEEIHGPARTGKPPTGDPRVTVMDFVQCLSCPGWPEVAREFPRRRRPSGWPPQSEVDAMRDAGCHVVAVGYSAGVERDLQWRWSFSLAEKTLVHRLPEPMAGCMYLLKALKQNGCFACEAPDEEPGINSYFMKTACLWVSEGTTIDDTVNAVSVVLMVVQWLMECYDTRRLPHYFIPEQNLLSRYTPETTERVLRQLGRLQENVTQPVLGCIPLHAPLLALINPIIGNTGSSGCVAYVSKCSHIHRLLSADEQVQLVRHLRSDGAHALTESMRCGGALYERERRVWSASWITLSLPSMFSPQAGELLLADPESTMPLPTSIMSLVRGAMPQQLRPATGKMLDTLNHAIDRYLGDVYAAYARYSLDNGLEDLVDRNIAEAERYYTSSLLMTPPGGHNDCGFGGSVRLAVLYYICQNAMALDEILRQMASMLNDVTNVLSDVKFLPDVVIRRDYDLWVLPWRTDAVLYRHLVEGCPDAWVYVSPLSLAWYIRAARAITRGERHLAEVTLEVMRGVPENSWYFIEHFRSHTRLVTAVTEKLS